MKVLVVASNGRVGKLVVKNALKKGFDVTGSGKGENLSEAGNFKKMHWTLPRKKYPDSMPSSTAPADGIKRPSTTSLMS